jgi:hypothetical protein
LISSALAPRAAARRQEAALQEAALQEAPGALPAAGQTAVGGQRKAVVLQREAAALKQKKQA